MCGRVARLQSCEREIYGDMRDGVTARSSSLPALSDDGYSVRAPVNRMCEPARSNAGTSVTRGLLTAWRGVRPTR